MGIRMPTLVLHAKQTLRTRPPHGHREAKAKVTATTAATDVPKGHFAVYVGESYNKHRFVVPITYLKHPLFQDLLRKAEEEFGFDHPMGGLTIPCSKDAFLNITSRLNNQQYY
ncbi:hypothetical protein LguiA_027600 [Lonicera macranthoides]